MHIPDFKMYDEGQLRQLLSRIDRDRFPDQVALIETRLAELVRDEPSLSAKLRPRDHSRELSYSRKFAVKSFPGTTMDVFGPALPFILIGMTTSGFAVFLESSLCRSTLFMAGLVVIAFGIIYFRLSTLDCPTCQDKCKRTILAHGNWGIICNRCEIQWDSGIGTDA